MKEKLKLKRIGFFCEMEHAEGNDPSIKEYIGKYLDVDSLDKTCQYLDKGIPVVVCCGFSRDIIKNDDSCAGCPSLLTDGEFVWPGDLSYYVRKYKVGLSHQFVDAMKKNKWIIPVDEKELKNKIIYVGKYKL